MYYQIRISETASNTLKEEKHRFNEYSKDLKTLEGVNEFLIKRYGKMPAKRNKIYVDNEDGTSTEVGFLHSYWNSNRSHNSKSWHQTDWVTITEVVEKPVLI